jgi:phosphoribosylaminoimidazole-succinocarboxamide synthase
VRDLYRLVDGQLLIVASDRVSAFDCVLGTISDNGEILTRLSVWWFEQLGDLVPHHVLCTDVPKVVAGRAVVCEELTMYPVECVARGYLAGEGLSEYRCTGTIGGIALAPGLTEGSRFRQPVPAAGVHPRYQRGSGPARRVHRPWSRSPGPSDPR